MVDETGKSGQGTPQSNGQSSGASNGSTSNGPKTYTEADVQKLISDKLAEQGRTHKTALDAVTLERDSYKGQVDTLTTAATEAAENQKQTETRVADLEADLQRAYTDNPDLAEIAKLKKDIAAEKAQLRADKKKSDDTAAELKKSLESQETKWAEKVAKYQASNLELEVFEIANAHEGGNAVALKALCAKDKEVLDAMKSGDDEALKKRIIEMADTIWAKKTAGSGADDFVPDSGMTSGTNTDDLTKLTPFAKIRAGIRERDKKH